MFRNLKNLANLKKMASNFGTSGADMKKKFSPSEIDKFSFPIRTQKGIQKQNYDFFLVLDFEATCEDGKTLEPQEIIEFPVLKIDNKTFQIQDTFHQYVQPTVNRVLTPFCTNLTGITQAMIDNQPNLQETLKMVDIWLKKDNDLLFNEDGSSRNFIFITCGDWDLKRMLPTQCKYFNINYPNYFRKWINIKKSFSDVTSVFPKGMPVMLNQLNLRLEGRHHSGIDDCKNIAKIVRELGNQGYVFKENGKLFDKP